MIPGGVTSIESDAFAYCSGLTSAVFEEGVTTIEGFHHCDNLVSVTIPESAAEIYGFSSCPRLTSVRIPKNVTRLGYNGFIVSSAFQDCYSLTDVYVESVNVSVYGTSFQDCPRTTKFHVHADTNIAAWAQAQGFSVDIEAHKPAVTPAVPATCTETGLTEGRHCSVCGAVLVEQEWVAPLVHIKNCTIDDIPDKVWTGRAIKPNPAVTDYYNYDYYGERLVKGTDYTITYKNNKEIGKATVTFKGKGRYGGSVKKTFVINPKAVALGKLTGGKKRLTITWKKGKGGITGYQLEYGLNADFSGAKKATVKGEATLKKVVKKLKSGNKYYVRIRTYKKVGKKTYYSKWSKTKSAKVK